MEIIWTKLLALAGAVNESNYNSKEIRVRERTIMRVWKDSPCLDVTYLMDECAR